ncbi:protein C1orf194 homolog [Gambusia affinis]|uniref:protein C1orf194 homolog n=1 Tax=Gambusia affinis TaxID=33528 RepID=UPI001CDBBDF5|nr:protein C1orf194 homolog [Gambusia affinis]XP_043983550.1 protein C1orf194 homolog [Gambusia affinis]
MSKLDPNPSFPNLGNEFSHRQAPKDSLDFKLTTIYNHHTDLFLSRYQMVCQRETVSFGERKREKLEKQLKLQHEQENGIRVWVDPKRNTYHYLT